MTKKIKPALLFVIFACVGCMTREQPKLQADAPVMLTPAAGKLAGAAPQDLVVETSNTIVDQPISTRIVRQVAESSKDAVVSIYVKTKMPYRLSLLPFALFGGIPMQVPGIGLGSGFFIHPAGYILTNNHVIEHAETIRILTSDDADYEVVVIARDPAYDLALLKVVDAPNRQFTALAMGDSNIIGSGDMVIAVGNQLGLGHTVTAGIISQTDRNLTGIPTEGTRHVRFIQTDTAINLGSSGGPLITLTGAWIGVNTAGVAQAQGINFAVPSSQVKEFLDKVRLGRGQIETKQTPADQQTTSTDFYF